MKRIVSITEQLVAELRACKAEDGCAVMAKPVPNCLVVEDDASDAELSVGALRAMGAEVTHAVTGDEAIRILTESCHNGRSDFHIVFLDLNLIGSAKNGYHVLRFIRQNFPKLHVVIVSGYIDDGLLNFISSDRQTGGYIGVIKKPLDRVDVSEIFSKHNLATRQRA